MWRYNGNPNPCTDLDEIPHTHPHLSKEGFGPGLTPSPWAWGGLKYIFENSLKNKIRSAGCILTRAMPGTSASF